MLDSVSDPVPLSSYFSSEPLEPEEVPEAGEASEGALFQTYESYRRPKLPALADASSKWASCRGEHCKLEWKLGARLEPLEGERFEARLTLQLLEKTLGSSGASPLVSVLGEEVWQDSVPQPADVVEAAEQLLSPLLARCEQVEACRGVVALLSEELS